MTIESAADLEGLKKVGKVVALARSTMRSSIEPGMTTKELDEIGREVLEKFGATSAPQNVYGFPAVNCLSLNEEAVHGVPRDSVVIVAGDLVKIDVTAELGGYIADSAETVIVPPASDLQERLTRCAETAFFRGAEVARAGRPLNRIGRVIQTTVEKAGFSVLRELYSHGVGRTIHESPTIPNYFDPAVTAKLTKGLVITIEPIISSGTPWTADSSDGWTISTADGSLSAHHEHTVVITNGKPLILTAA